MGILAYLKYGVNSAIGTVWHRPLSDIIGARLLLVGPPGVLFKITSGDLYFENTEVTIDDSWPSFDYDYYYMYLPVAYGQYTIDILVNGNVVKTHDVTLTPENSFFKPTYQSVTLITTVTANSIYTLPAITEIGFSKKSIFVTALGGGGGGGGAGGGYDGYGGYGGAGGEAGTKVTLHKIDAQNPLDITVGVGGAGGKGGSSGNAGTAGSPGGSTIIGAQLTIPGGYGGAGGKRGVDGTGYAGKAGTAGAANIDGTQAAAGTASTGSSITATAGAAGTLGGGGGGGSGGYRNASGTAGGKGGDGVVRVYKGVVVE